VHAGLWLSGRHPPAGLKYLAKFHELEVSHGGCALDHFGARALHGGSDWIGAAFCGAGFFAMHESCATPGLGKPLGCRGTDPRLRPMQNTNVDLELLRLEEDLRVARERLARIIRMVPDPAVLKAAEDLCAKAMAALAAYRRKKA
jgi:hypothetical protein